MNFKDSSNNKCTEYRLGCIGRVSRRCPIEPVHRETPRSPTRPRPQCAPGSVNRGLMVRPDPGYLSAFDNFYCWLEVVSLAVPFLDRVVDINFYLIDAVVAPTSSGGRWW